MIKTNENQRKDLFLISISILLVVLTVFIIFQFSSFLLNPRKSLHRIIGSAYLTIDFGNGTKRVFNGEIVENENLLDVLTQTSKAGVFSYGLNEKNDLISVDTFMNNSKKSWYWYLNGEKINKKPGEANVKSNDNILIKYE